MATHEMASGEADYRRFVEASQKLDAWMCVALDAQNVDWPPRDGNVERAVAVVEAVAEIVESGRSVGWDAWKMFDVIASLGSPGDVAEIDIRTSSDNRSEIFVGASGHECCIRVVHLFFDRLAPVWESVLSKASKVDSERVVKEFVTTIPVDNAGLRRLLARIRRERAGVAIHFGKRLRSISPLNQAEAWFKDPQLIQTKRLLKLAGIADTRTLKKYCEGRAIPAIQKTPRSYIVSAAWIKEREAEKPQKSCK